ncbi:MAG: methionine adenosyltransferase [Aristaeellaceae bacterium]
MTTLFTSESVTEGHPDKLCDRIADSVLDALLGQDPESRCACEVTCEPQLVRVMGEITTRASVDYEKIARQAIREVGYTDPAWGFDADSVRVEVSLRRQSPDIARGVDCAMEARTGGAAELGAGDQGMMFGFACDETASLMPLPIELAHALTARLALVRRAKLLSCLRPDGKAQVTVEYRDGKPVRVHTIVVSAQHDPLESMDALRRDIMEHVIRPAIPAQLLDDDTRCYINPTGRFVLGGPAADTGLTGRKIIVDTYGGYARHGGGAFSGKDPTKVDRSACYMARYLAKNVVAAGLARQCEIQLSYAIGVAHPVSVMVDTRGTGIIADEQIIRRLRHAVHLTPETIIADLHLRQPIYTATSAYGHFGANAARMPWEKTDLASFLTYCA